MGRPAKLVEPRREAAADAPPTLDAVAVALPPAGSAFTRADGVSLAVAGFLHLAVLGVFVAPDRRFGSGGVDLEAIGVDIVTVAPALDARANARGRGAAAANVQVSEHDGAAEAVPEETATRDSSREERQADVPPLPADLVVRDWREAMPPEDAPAKEPVIAQTKGDGVLPDRPETPRPSEPDEQRLQQDSISAHQVLQRFRGGAAARGREDTPQTAFVMAAARAGQRDAYKEAIVLAVRASPPGNATGHSGEVKLEFRVRPDGSIGDIRVASSSGSELLDQVAVGAMRTLRLPPPPAGLSPDQLIYDMPFIFR